MKRTPAILTGVVATAFFFGVNAEEPEIDSSVIMTATQDSAIVSSQEQTPAPEPERALFTHETPSEPRNKSNSTALGREFGSAYSLAKTGVVLHGVGRGVQLVGMALVVSEVIKSDEMEMDTSTLFAGSTMVLVGFGMALAGPIVSCVGGTKARGLNQAGGIEASPFRGWGYLAGGAGFWAAGNLLARSNVPYIPMMFSLGAEAMFIAALTQSIRYTRTAFYGHAQTHTITLTPLYARKGAGLQLSAGF